MYIYKRLLEDIKGNIVVYYTVGLLVEARDSLSRITVFTSLPFSFAASLQVVCWVCLHNPKGQPTVVRYTTGSATEIQPQQLQTQSCPAPPGCRHAISDHYAYYSAAVDIKAKSTWSSGKDIELKIKRFGVRFPLQVMCGSVGQTSSLRAASVHPAVMSTWYTDPG